MVNVIYWACIGRLCIGIVSRALLLHCIGWCHAILDEAHRISIDVRQGAVTRKSKGEALNISED